MNRSDLDAATDLAPLVNATQHGGVDDEQAVLILNQRRVVEVVLVVTVLVLGGVVAGLHGSPHDAHGWSPRE